MSAATTSIQFVELHRDQTRAAWLDGHRHAFEFFGGVPRIVVPDNPKALIWDHRHDVVLDPSYQEFAAHYHVAVVPARPGRPRDKAKVENHVLLAERWIAAPLRQTRLVGWTVAQARVRERLQQLNARPFQRLPGSRVQLFQDDERAALQPLPATPYEFGEWRPATVSRDDPIHLGAVADRVPFTLVGAVVDVRVSATRVAIVHPHQRVASHPRADRPGTYRTLPEHMPPHHRAVHAGWSRDRLLERAAAVGPATRQLIETILARAVIPEPVDTRCRGLLRLAEPDGATVFERTAERA